MPRYRVKVTEVRHAFCVYTVVAATRDQAAKAAMVDNPPSAASSAYKITGGQPSGGPGFIESVGLDGSAAVSVAVVDRRVGPVAQAEAVGPHPYPVGDYFKLREAAAADDAAGRMRVAPAGSMVEIKAVDYYPTQGYTYRTATTLEDGTALTLIYTEAEAVEEWEHD